VAAIARTHPAAPQSISVAIGAHAPLPLKYSTLRSSETPEPCGTIAVNVE
jgi:hypothetical protein